MPHLFTVNADAPQARPLFGTAPLFPVEALQPQPILLVHTNLPRQRTTDGRRHDHFELVREAPRVAVEMPAKPLVTLIQPSDLRQEMPPHGRLMIKLALRLVVREERVFLLLRELQVGEIVGERDRLGVREFFGCCGLELF